MRTKFYRRADVTISDRKVRKQFHGRRQVLFGREGLGLGPSVSRLLAVLLCSASRAPRTARSAAGGEK